MFEVRCFHLGKVEGLFLGQDLPSCGGSSNSGLLLWGQGGSQEESWLRETPTPRHGLGTDNRCYRGHLRIPAESFGSLTASAKGLFWQPRKAWVLTMMASRVVPHIMPRGHCVCPLVGPGKARQVSSFWGSCPVSQGWVMGLFLLPPGPGHHLSLVPGSIHCSEVYLWHWFLVEKLTLGM